MSDILDTLSASYAENDHTERYNWTLQCYILYHFLLNIHLFSFFFSFFFLGALDVVGAELNPDKSPVLASASYRRTLAQALFYKVECCLRREELL